MNKNIKLIALDMDGTLLDSKKHLSEKNRQVLNACIRQGIYVVPATGRVPDGIDYIVDALPGVRYSINTNGAMIWDWQEKQTLASCKMSWEKALEVMGKADGMRVMYDPYIEGRGISEPRFLNHLEDYSLSAEVQQLVRNTRDQVENIQEYVRTYKKEVEKVNFFFADLKDRDIMRGRLNSIEGIVVTSSMYNNLEINAQDATKGAALRKLALYLGLQVGETMAFGDGENDMVMIKEAGIGVAMGNGEESLKAEADFVTISNDEDGVAYAIEKLIFGHE